MNLLVHLIIPVSNKLDYMLTISGSKVNVTVQIQISKCRLGDVQKPFASMSVIVNRDFLDSLIYIQVIPDKRIITCRQSYQIITSQSSGYPRNFNANLHICKPMTQDFRWSRCIYSKRSLTSFNYEQQET